MNSYHPHTRPARHRSHTRDYLLGCLGWVAVFALALLAEPIVDVLLSLF